MAGEEFGRAYVYLPLLIAIEALLISALAFFFASITPFIPDMGIALANLLRLLFFLSGAAGLVYQISWSRQIGLWFGHTAQAAAATGCAHSRLTTQGVFLERLGLTARAQALANGQNEALVEAITSAHRRLTHGREMGNLFKVLGLYPAQAAAAPGLDP